MRLIKCEFCGEQSIPGKFCTECGKPLNVQDEGGLLDKEKIVRNVTDAVSQVISQTGLDSDIEPESQTDKPSQENVLICPSCSMETASGKFCTECGQRLCLADALPGTDEDTSAISNQLDDSGDKSSSEKELRKTYKGHIIDRAEIIEGFCPRCNRPVLSDLYKYCPHKDCDASFLKENEPALRIYAVLQKPLIKDKMDIITLRVENVGDNNAFMIRAECKAMRAGIFPSRLRLPSIEPGKYSLLDVNVCFENSGIAQSEFKITYHDEKNSEYSLIEQNLVFEVLPEFDSNKSKEHAGNPEKQVILHIENFVQGDLKKGTFTEIIDSVVNRSKIGSENVTIDHETPKAPEPPKNLHAFIEDNKVGLTWDSVSGAQKYRIERSDGKPLRFQLIDEVTETGFLDSMVGGGTCYYYRVIASGPGGASEPSNEVAIELGIHYEVDSSIILKCGFREQKFRIICAPYLLIGRDSTREDNLVNHIPLCKETYLSRKQIKITKSGDYFNLNQGNAPRRIYQNNELLDHRFNISKAMNLNIKVNRDGSLYDIQFIPLFSHGKPSALMIYTQDDIVLFVPESVILEWNPPVQNALNSVSDDSFEDNIKINVKDMKAGDTVDIGYSRILVEKLARKKIFESNEKGKWGDTLYSVNTIHDSSVISDTDPCRTIDETILDVGDKIRFSIIYDSSKPDFMIHAMI
ncbi:hypothetical protein KKB99_02935 [bacterium]|nr:hypothetical protein [bacterium]MBU1024944.1 hypothetical protein [bacterium]